MIYLIYQLSWFLLGMSGLISATLAMTVLLKRNKPEAAFIMSKLSLALSCVAALTVTYSTGYISMKLYVADDETTCSFFGLKINPNATHLSKQPKVNASAASVFWMVITEDWVELEKVLLWICFWLCIGCIFSLFIVLYKSSEQRQIDRMKDIRTEFVKNFMQSHLQKFPFSEKDKGTKIKRPIKIQDCPGMRRSISFGVSFPYVQPVTKRSLWASSAAMGIFCVALIGATLLSHFYGVAQDRLLTKICVSPHYVPPGHMATAGTTHNNTKAVIPSPIHIVSREEWMAKSPKDSSPLKNPVSHVVVTHTPAGSCSSDDECMAAVRAIQATNMGPGEGLWDISGNFMIAGDGRAYMGRGWNAKAESAGYFDNDSITVMFMGTTIYTIPTKDQVETFNKLIAEGIRAGHVAKGVKIVLGRKSKKSELKALFN